MPPDTLTRTRLTAQLQEGLSLPLTLVTAPGGFGKTILLATGLEDCPWPVAWLSLDDWDSDLTAFVRCLVAAIQRPFPEAGRTTLSVLQLPTPPSPGLVAGVIQEDLGELPDHVVLVLDDYQIIRNPEVHALMGALLRHPSARLHLVVASRQSPPWPLARLRADEQLTEIDISDLRFTEVETSEFLERVARRHIDGALAAAVHERAAGWAVPLRLAASALREGGEARLAVEGLEGRAAEHLAQYVLEEIVGPQGPEARELLQRTSILDRFPIQLADALMDWQDGALNSFRVLKPLREAGLFVSSLNGERGWYQYHDLLRDALQYDLRMHHSSEAIRALHARASVWFADHGHVEAALGHALDADDPERAADFVERNTPTALDLYEWQRLEAWLRMLPAFLIQSRPPLLLAQAWVYLFRYLFDLMPALLDAAGALLERDEHDLPSDRLSELRAEIDVLRGVLTMAAGDGRRGAELIQPALGHLAPSAAFVAGQGGMYGAMALQMIGNSEAAAELLSSVRVSELRGESRGAMRWWQGMLYVQFADGDYRRSEQTAKRILELARSEDMELFASWGHYALGRIYYEWNQLGAAEEHFVSMVNLRHKANVLGVRACLQGLALVEATQRRRPDATREIAALAPTTWNVNEAIARSFEARFALSMGDLDAAVRWLQTAEPAPPFQLPLDVEVPQITHAKVLLAVGTEAAVEDAARRLADLLELYESRHDTARVIEILALQALVCQARTELEAGLTLLERAVALAEPGGFIRTFLDLGPSLARLLTELGRRTEHREYVARLLEEFAAHVQGFAPALPTREAARPAEMVEPLTNRELDVLALLDGRLTNKEIAGRLFISWQTVAKHTVNIYQKLHVTGRRAAVDRAKALGLLPQSHR